MYSNNKLLLLCVVSTLFLLARCQQPEVCRETPAPPLATADVIVIGSGPGGTGFLKRLTTHPALNSNSSNSGNATNNNRPSVLWFEKGVDFVAEIWPADLRANPAVMETVLETFPRRKMNWQKGQMWNCFGGGDCANSGGPNYLGLLRNPEPEPYTEYDVFALRNNTVVPTTQSSQRWVQAFAESGYEVIRAAKNDNNDNNNNNMAPHARRQHVKNQIGLVSTTLGDPSSTTTTNGVRKKRRRIITAQEIRDDPRNGVTFVRARVTSIVHSNDGVARGVRGVRIDDETNEEFGGCVTWEATQAVVLAGGVVNSFDVLVESGIGPERYLEVRGIPPEWRVPNEDVGTEVGDELTALYLSLEPERQDAALPTQQLSADNVDDSAFTFWSHGAEALFPFLSLSSFTIDFLLSLPLISSVMNSLFARMSAWTIGLTMGDPTFSLVATARSTSLRRSENSIGVTLDDSSLQNWDKECESLNRALLPLKKGIEMQAKARKETPFISWLLGFGLWLRLEKLMQPLSITKHNIDGFTGSGENSGKNCKLNQFMSIYHYFGGNVKVVDESYRVKGFSQLYISDASILNSVAAGGPNSEVMEVGMKVADAMVNDIYE